MTEAKAVRLVKAALREAGLPEAEGGLGGSPVTRAGWHVGRAGNGARVGYWGTQVLPEAEKRAALAGCAPVLRAAGWVVAPDERGGFLAVLAVRPEEDGND